jgi:hypothetical protein
MLFIGSIALNNLGIDLGRPYSDIDVICTEAEFDQMIADAGDAYVTSYDTSSRSRALHISGQKPTDAEIAKPGSSAEALLDLIANEKDMRRHAIRIGGPIYASPDLVYTMKMSHRYLKNSPHFAKTMRDIRILREHGCVIPEILKPWYSFRVKETYAYKHPNLNQRKQGFFSDDDVPYVYDHDTIHEAIKLYDRPAFEFIKRDQSEVFCSREKFDEAPDHIKIASVLEESYVLAIERHQVPNDFKPDRRVSFLIALEKVCTSIASGWWREYAWENYETVKAAYDPAYLDRFHAGVANETVRKFQTI